LLTSSRHYLVAITLLTISFLSATAQTSAPITVTTDKTTYSDGNTIIVSGTVAEQLNIPISIIIKDSSNNIVYVAQTSPTSGNTYSTQVVAGGDLWKMTGTYEIDVTYGGQDKTSNTTFQFTPTAPAPTPIPASPNSAIPEFGPLSAAIFAISTMAVVILYTRVKTSFKF
jgi:hypothetical protein